MLFAADPLNECAQKHAITQTSWGSLSVYYIHDKGTRCVEPGKDDRLATNPSANCRDIDHAITQTPWGGLYVYYLTGEQTWCAVPAKDDRIARDQGIDPYIALTTNCNDAEDKRFNFGKLFLFVCS
jgi:hypothetical protein